MRPIRHAAHTLLLVTWAASAAAQSAEDALARAAATYAQVVTFRAWFVQVITNPMLSGADSSRGTLFLARPNQFAMRFTDPPGDRIVADGKVLWVYLPSSIEGQVLRRPIPAEGGSGPNLFGQFLDRPLERYRATYVGTVELAGLTHSEVRLEPLSADWAFRSAVIAIGRADGLVRRLVIHEVSGLSRTLVLSEVMINGDIPDEEFRFSPPPGARIVQQL